MHMMAYRIATGLKNRAPSHHASVEVLQFAIEALINLIGTVMLALAISLVTGEIRTTILALLSLAMLRIISGGIHLKYSWACTILTAIVSNVASFSNFPYTFVVIATSISIILAAIFAPSRIEGQTRIPKRFFPLLKLLAITVISVNYFIGSSVIASAFLIQSLMLIRKGGSHNATN